MTKDPAHDFNCERHDRECFVCGKMMVEDYPRKDHNPLQANWHDATDWTTYGNWCSSVVDCAIGGPKNWRCSHIVICDECYKERKDRIVEVQYTKEEKQKNEEERRISWEEFKQWWRRDGSSQLKKE